MMKKILLKLKQENVILYLKIACGIGNLFFLLYPLLKLNEVKEFSGDDYINYFKAWYILSGSNHDYGRAMVFMLLTAGVLYFFEYTEKKNPETLEAAKIDGYVGLFASITALALQIYVLSDVI